VTVNWNIGDRVLRVGEDTVYVIESFRKDGDRTIAVARAQGTEKRREIVIDVATPVLFKKVG
jgi:hypothetical protein